MSIPIGLVLKAILNVLGTKDKNKKICIIGIIIFSFIFALPLCYYIIKEPWRIAGEVAGKFIASKTGEITNNISVFWGGNEPKVSQSQFIQKIAIDTKGLYNQYRIFSSITIAQAIIESNWGNSGLAQKANNLFGIKNYNWMGASISMQTQEEYAGIKQTITANFRAYSSWKDSIIDHTQFLIENSCYKKNGVFDAKNYTEQAWALQRAGYATDSSYATSLIEVIKSYNLMKYDN